jgi:capsular polysaccharide biosynthesis protein
MGSPNKEQYVLKENMKDINIKEFFEVMKRRFWIIVLVTVIATAAGYYYSTTQKETLLYQTSTRIIIESDDKYMSTLMVMIKDPIVMGNVQSVLSLSRSPESIAGQIDVSRVDESQVIRIGVTDQDPEMAMNIANATAKSFKSEVGNILGFKDVRLLSEAKENNAPINEQNKNTFIIIAFAFGLITGTGLVFLIDSLDEKVDKESQVEEILGVPVIGGISNMKIKKLSTKKGSQREMELRGENVGSNK